VLDLAAGSLGQLGVASAAEAVVGTLNADGMTADQAVGVTDRLLRITQLTKLSDPRLRSGPGQGRCHRRGLQPGTQRCADHHGAPAQPEQRRLERGHRLP